MTARSLQTATITAIGAPTLGSLMRTTRYSRAGTEAVEAARAMGRPIVYALWHGRLLPLAWYHRHWRLATLISPSRDGEYIAGIVERWGYTVVRGSSSRRGDRALRELVRLARAGQDLAITPDGPRGPREVVKPGVIITARLAGATIIPVSAATDHAWWFEAWDRFLVPQPFAHVRIAYGEPIFVPREAAAVEVEAARARAERDLKRLTADLDGLCA